MKLIRLIEEMPGRDYYLDVILYETPRVGGELIEIPVGDSYEASEVHMVTHVPGLPFILVSVEFSDPSGSPDANMARVTSIGFRPIEDRYATWRLLS